MAHLALNSVLFSILLLCSGELQAMSKSNHIGFFTEIGFWLQESGMALCGLVSLAAFIHLLQVSCITKATADATNITDCLHPLPSTPTRRRV